MNPKGVSVIICTYNGKQRLHDTLQHLVWQELTCACEIIVVDNASNDGTRDFVDQWWVKHGVSHIDFISYDEPKAGKSYAQELGHKKASYEYILICDDDNWLHSQYIQTAYDIMESNDHIGALGGRSEATFENDKPEWFDNYARFYAVSKQGAESGDITDKKGCLYGAGMMLRKSHWEYLNTLGFQPILTCRRDDKLVSGEDTEYCYALRLLGYKIWYDDRLQFKHYMTQGRMNRKYLSKLRKAVSHSNFVISAYRDQLNRVKKTKKTFRKYLRRKLVYESPRNVWKRFFGNYEQKEEAKEFFRTIYRLQYSYKEYAAHKLSITKWLPEKYLHND